LFQLDDTWVLLVSVWDDDELFYVAAAVGDYDGRRFEPRSWQRLTHGSSAYAMTAFADKDGRRCVLSWLREEPRNDPDRVGWVGAHSVAAVLSRGPDGRLVLSPHPDLAALITSAPRPAAVDLDGRLRLPMESGTAEITLRPVPGSSFSVLSDLGELALVEFTDSLATISRPDRPAEQMPVDMTQPLVVLVDADIVEIFGPSAYGAFRVGAATGAATTELAFSSSHPEMSVRIF
jgi:beta-fructofuranosidase